jgi:hypothetical protein
VLAATGTTVFHIFQNRQCIGNVLVGAMPFDVGNKSDPTGIMFKRRMI